MLPSGQSVHLVRFPQEKSLFQEIFEQEKQTMGEAESLDSVLRHIAGVMEPIQARVPYELHIR